MQLFKCKGKVYEMDSNGFLLDPIKWDRDLAEGLAPELGLPGGLIREHWEVIGFIRTSFEHSGRCPNVFETCRANHLRRRDLQRLFPKGYMGGACRLAGVS